MRFLIVLSLVFGIAIAVPLGGGLYDGISHHVAGIEEVGFDREIDISVGHKNPEPLKPMPLLDPEPHPLRNLTPPYPSSAMHEEESPSHERLPYPDSVPPGFENPLTDPMPPPGWQPHKPPNPEHLLNDSLPLQPPGAMREEEGPLHERLPYPDSGPPGFDNPLTDPMSLTGWQPREPLNSEHILSNPIPPRMEPHDEPGYDHPLGDPIPSRIELHREPGHDHPLSDPILPRMELHDEPEHDYSLSDSIPPRMELHDEPGYDYPLGDPVPSRIELQDEAGHDYPLSHSIPPRMEPHDDFGHYHPDPIPPRMKQHDEQGHHLRDTVPPGGWQSRQEISLEDTVPEGDVYPPSNGRRQQMAEEEPLDLETFLLFATFADPPPALSADFF